MKSGMTEKELTEACIKAGKSIQAMNKDIDQWIKTLSKIRHEKLANHKRNSRS